jgi:hypothetical protein
MLAQSLPSRLVERFAGRLRFPALFLVTAALFLVDLAIPDVIPFVDEVLLGLGTLVLGSWKKRRRDAPSSSGVETGGPGA